MKIAIELINLYNAASASPELSYEPVWISNDKRERNIANTTMKYAQIGGPTINDKIGTAFGPIFKVEFVDLSAVTATHIKIWGLLNKVDEDAPLYPVSYLEANPIMDIWLRKFEFTDSAGNPVAAGGAYSIIGHREKNYPMQF